MQVNQQTIAALTKGYRVLFMDALQANPSNLLHPKLCMEVSSTNAEEIYHWLGAIPGFRKLVGEAVIKNLTANKWSIGNEEWEDTVRVGQKDIERDSYGIYNPLFQSMGEVAQQHPDELLGNLLANGFTQPCYTGKNFFDINHEPKKGGTKFSNKGTKKFSQANFRTGRTNIRSRLNSEGRTMKLGTNLTLVVSPTYESTAREVLFADKLANGATNVDVGTAKLEVMPELMAVNEHAWFLMEMGKSIKPFIRQIEKPVQFLTTATGMTTEELLLTHAYLYQGYTRYNLGYALPELTYGSTGADAA